MTASTTVSLTSDVWHLSLDNLLAPLPQMLRLGGSGPFVINLSASIAPFDLPVNGVAGCPQAHVYQVQHTEDGRRRYRLRLGPFASEDEADEALKIVRETYPSALTATASAADLRAITSLQPKVIVSVAAPRLPTKDIPPTSLQMPVEPISTIPTAVISDTCAVELAANEQEACHTVPVESTAPAPLIAPAQSELTLVEFEYDLVAVAAPTGGDVVAHQSSSSDEVHQNLPAATNLQSDRELTFVEFEYDLTPVSAPVTNEPGVQPSQASAAPVAQGLTFLELEEHKAPAVHATEPAEPEEESVEVVRARLAKQLALLECDEDKPAVVSTPVKNKSVIHPRSLDNADPKSPRAARAQLAKELALVDRNAAKMAAPKSPLGSSIVPPHAISQPSDELMQLELQADDASAGFVVQLSLAAEAFDPDTVPTIDIFNIYHLYSVAGIDQGRIMHALRLGFFSDETSASAVANYLRAFYDQAAIKRVGTTERERFSKKSLAPRKDIGATGKQATIEITSERFIREKRIG